MLIKFTKLLPNNTGCVVRFYATATAAAAAPAPATKTLRTKPKADRSTIRKSTAHIQCKRPEFNLLRPATEDSKFGTIPLASKGWLHQKSKKDYFIINPTVTESQLQAEFQNLEDFLTTTGLKFDEYLIENLTKQLEIKQLTGIQVNGIPKICDSHHTLIAAETGCGKTLTYLLPIVQQVLQRKNKESDLKQHRDFNTPLAIIITPGRELATQIGSVAEKLTKDLNINVQTILGGNTKRLLLNPEFGEVDILVATIGALSKLVTTSIYRVQQVRHVVLDEADTLLDDSFTEKLYHFLKRFPFHKNHLQDDKAVGTQLILASATMPTNISELLRRIVTVNTIHEVISPNLHKLMPHVEQKFFRMSKADRPANLLVTTKTELAKKRPLIIFSNKTATSDYISLFLNNSGINCINLNGDMLMKIRIGRFGQFQNGNCDVLSTTDIGSRGLDTTRARHVINFDFPMHISDYIHRCGRIGRVGCLHKCIVTNFISSRREVELVQRIEHTARTGGILPNVNANIKSLINQKIIKDMRAAGIELPPNDADPKNKEEDDEVF